MDVSVLTSSKDHDKLDARVVITSYDLMARQVDELGDRARAFRVLIMVRPATASASIHLVVMPECPLDSFAKAVSLSCVGRVAQPAQRQVLQVAMCCCARRGMCLPHSFSLQNFVLIRMLYYRLH